MPNARRACFSIRVYPPSHFPAIERRFSVREQLLQWQKRKGFLHRMVKGDEKWIHYSNSKRRKSWGLPGHGSTNIHAAKVMLYFWWDQVGVIYYIETQRNYYWGTVSTSIDAIEASSARKTATILAEVRKSDATA